MPNEDNIIKATNVHWHEGNVSRAERVGLRGHNGCTVWFTGLSASGKSTIACALEQALLQLRLCTYRLDGDNVRMGLNRNLGFSAADRAENIRRVGEVAKLFADSCCICLTSFISPYAADRDAARELHERDGFQFFEVYLKVPLDVAEERDPKGLYKKARAGLIKGFTGIDDPYEAPTSPSLVVDTSKCSVEQSVELVLEMLHEKGVLSV